MKFNAIFTVAKSLGKDDRGDYMRIDGTELYINRMFNEIYDADGLKYPRAGKLDRTPYVTGDAQDWTYKYTWEDLEEAEHDDSSDVRAFSNRVCHKVHAYFKRYPDEAEIARRQMREIRALRGIIDESHQKEIRLLCDLVQNGGHKIQ